MEEYQNTQEIRNQIVNKDIKVNNLGKKKNVTFKDTIIIISVPSYKELTKKMCYNEEEGFVQYYGNAPYGKNSHPYYDYKSLYNRVLKYKKNRPKKYSNNECTCIIL